MAKEYGIIYMLTNPCMKGLVKIGKTGNDIKTRMSGLWSTGVPMPFDLKYAGLVPLDKIDEIETAIHTAFSTSRVHPRREFFRIENPDNIIPLLKVICGCSITDDVTEDMQEQLDLVQDELKTDVRMKRPNFDFFKLGLKVGDSIFYTRQEDISCTIVDAKHVAYKDAPSVSLSAVTRDLCQYTTAPLGFWKTTDGTLLSDIYERVYNTVERVCACENKLTDLASDTIQLQAGFEELSKRPIQL